MSPVCFVCVWGGVRVCVCACVYCTCSVCGGGA